VPYEPSLYHIGAAYMAVIELQTLNPQTPENYKKQMNVKTMLDEVIHLTAINSQ